MIAATTFKHSLIAVFGLGRSGLASAHALMAGGAKVVAWDDNNESVSHAASLGIAVHDLRFIDWSQVNALLLSPGVPLTHPHPHWTVSLAQKAKVEIIGDLEIFARERRMMSSKVDFIAVTGTNGKSTTTALIAHILRKNSYDVQLGGNIGNPVLNLAPFKKDCFYVIECSSYQIELAPTLDPSIGILLNISSDHLDRHGSMDHYIDIKKRLVVMSDRAVIGTNDHSCKKIVEQLRISGKEVVCISSGAVSGFKNDVYIDDLCIKSSYNSEILINLNTHTVLRGFHNAQNIAAALAVCLQLGLQLEEIRLGISSFPGLMHRMQLIARLGKILFINDSKATNVHSATKALTSENRIYWIAGGLQKSESITELAAFSSNIVKAYFIGDSAKNFAREFKNSMAYEISGTLEKALASATRDAIISDLPSVILFSPACASFDQYKNFEERGKSFIIHVSEIKNVEMLVDLSQERDLLW
ncbi:UDP-N-acetylmuramoylalanine--D-glutamate ligase [Liberibacter crescens BT-1]|uniref:UDP-N-acetylmuramoylalanine--D-glutamate ligase n=1 Tax=Liberibacter crescens (strain BT-1) TaxID=1215343 RepID=L0EV31_LIBCB|nr:UDP-N-acetylmuramoyl-L-alanine--D-glutamate ligase [Liberibacter crescens]AGA64705.1 UDP-N-acetylmuramoylalanine--D-glutamate ligase [Liberibacter crescens BT-1]AMC12798.1 UDP-N-acetylmuramoyl-L-alanyl-D-glutamate synthetase [Liberibacter crescens]